MIRLRASSLTLAGRCPAAPATIKETREQFDIPDDVSGELSRVGSAAHESRENPEKKLDVIARERHVPLPELRFLANAMNRHEEGVDPDWTKREIAISQPLPSYGAVLTGTIDYVRYWERWGLLVVGDYKTGRLAPIEDPDPEHHGQLRAYAGIYAQVAKAEGLEVKRVRGELLYVRESRPATHEWTGDAIDELYQDVIRDAQRYLAFYRSPPTDRTYHTGEHCRYAHCRRVCQAFRSDFESSLQVFQPEGSDLIITVDNAGALFGRAKVVAKLAQDVKDALREFIRDTGSVEHDGKYLELRPQMRRPALSKAAIDTSIREVITDDDLIGRKVEDVIVEVLETLDDRDTQPTDGVLNLYKEPKG